MPRLELRHPDHDRTRSLGWLAVAWIEFFCVHGAGDAAGRPVLMSDEQTNFVVDCYCVGPDGRRLYKSVFLSRPKGWDKSGLASRIALFEAFGPCRTLLDEDGNPIFAEEGDFYEDPWGLGFRYDYEPGEPIGRHINQPKLRCMATEVTQTGNTYASIKFNLEQTTLASALDDPTAVGYTRTLLPKLFNGGDIIPSTAGAGSKDGGLETFVVFDESHRYNTKELREMYDVVANNMTKRPESEPWYLETTTMYAEGEDSIAERTYKEAEGALEQRAKGKKTRYANPRLLVDHRWGEIEPEEIYDDEAKLETALREAYGDAIEPVGWKRMDELVERVLKPGTGPEDGLRFFLNSRASAKNAWITPAEWKPCAFDYKDEEGWTTHRDMEPPRHGDTITLGFDGSSGRKRGVADATALVATRVSDGLQWEVGVWEQPHGIEGWTPPKDIIIATIHETFKNYKVIGLFADPAAGWALDLADLEARYGDKMIARAGQRGPMQRWMTGDSSKRTVESLERYRSSVINREVTYIDSPTLTKHVINARMKASSSGIQIVKENPDSPNKIDAAVAAVLSWEARLAAIAKGANQPAAGRITIGRIR